MPSTTVTHEEFRARKSEMLDKTPYQIFTEAADIIEKDPVLTPGSYSEPRLFNKVTGEALTYYFDVAELEDPENWDSRPCHCLEGAMQEAGGVFITTATYPGWLTIIKGLELVWSEVWEERLNETLAKQFDIAKLREQGYFTDCISIDEAIAKGSVNDVVYTYSDRVLAPLKREGVLEAARLLRAAAETVKGEK